MTMQRGANAAVDGPEARVTLTWPRTPGIEADASAYLLGPDGRVRGDADMVFYNQPIAEGGAIRFADGVFTVALDRVAPAIDRIVFCLTAASGTLGPLDGAEIAVDAAARLTFRPALTGATEAAMILGELYRRAGQWKFRAVGQGFDGGLAPLARSFGIDVAEPAPPPPPPPPVRLTKVTLDKPRQSVSLAKPTGEIVINLNWSRGTAPAPAPSRGWGLGLGAALSGGRGAGSTAIDLDLGCLFELQDGTKSGIQALGRSFGNYNDLPWIELSGDDRSGDAAKGETIRVNGRHWDRIRRILVFAMIYEGAPNWGATDGVVTVAVPGEPPIEVRMTEGRNDRRLCAVALLENSGAGFTATRLVDYHRGQRDLDAAHGWGLQWAAGSKD